MPVQACILLSDAEAAAAKALNATSIAAGGGGVEARKIDNPVANQIVGLGDLTGNILGLNYLPARLLVDPNYVTFMPIIANHSIYMLDSELLFLPQDDV